MQPSPPIPEDQPTDQPDQPDQPRLAPMGQGRSRGGRNTLDDIADDLALWIDQISTEVALAFAPGRAPFSANVSEDQKLAFYRSRLFNPDGSPNPQGRDAELQRLGSSGFTQVYKAVINRWPELRIPTPEEMPALQVPEQWPGAPPGPPGAPPGLPGGLPPGIAAAGGGPPGPPMPVPPRPPMMPPGR
jgi:hypothetical protein